MSAAQTRPAPLPVTLFQNVRIFDGKGATASRPLNALVRGTLIERVTAESIAPPATAPVIDAAGRAPTPGLIDAHWHAMLVRTDPVAAINADSGIIGAASAVPP